jgi:hypothetical protein
VTTLTLTPGTQGGSDYVTKPSGIASAEVAVWNGAQFVRSTVTKVGYSSLNLTGNILNADLAGSIASTKISGTAVTLADTGTVTSTMILDGTIVNADISASAAIDRSKLTNLGICRFRATRTSTQSIATATNTKVQLSSETFDPSGVFDNATNYRFLPTTAGKYQINATVGITGLGDGKYLTCQIWKNGALYSQTQINNGAATDASFSHVDLVDMNGSSDYVELYISHNHGSNLNTIVNQVILSGFWVGV